MAEFAASIIGIVSAGAKVTLLLSQIAADVGSAGKEARMVGSEIRSFCAVIKTLGDALGKIQASQYYKHCAELIEPMTETSMEMFTEILDASESLKVMAKGKDGKDSKFGFVGRVQWAIFQKPKIMVLRAAIEAYKSNLALMLATLNTAEKVARLSPTQASAELICEEEKDRSLLQSLELEHRASMIELEEVEQQYRRSAVDESIETSSLEALGAPTTPIEMSANSALRPWMDDLVGSAREEIQSIRSSLSKSSLFDVRKVQGQVSRQSERLSVLMAEDQHRISQRWSAIISLSAGSSSHSRAIGGETALAHRHESSVRGELPILTSSGDAKRVALDPHKALLEPFYYEVTNWLMQQPLDSRTVILRALERDIFAPPLDPLGSPPNTVQIPDALKDQSQDHNQSHQLLDSRLPKWDYDEFLYQPEVGEIVKRVEHQLNRHNTLMYGSVERSTVDLSDKKLLWLDEGVFINALTSRVTRLILSRNRLDNLPHTLSLCSQLRHLDLGGNRFSYVPNAVLQLSSLETLDISGNELRVLPQALSNLASLKVLSVNDNKIRGLPLAIGDMPKLALLRYKDNPVEFPSAEALDAFIPNKYAPTPQNDDEEGFQNTKRLKAFLKMTFQLSPNAERAIENAPDPFLKDNSHARVLPRIQEYPVPHPGTHNIYDSPGFALEMPTISNVTRPELTPSQSLPAFATHLQHPDLEQTSTQRLLPTHRKSRSHDVSSKSRTGVLLAENTSTRRNSFNSSMPAFSLADVLDEEQPILVKPATKSHVKARPSLTVFERADMLLGRTKKRS